MKTRLPGKQMVAVVGGGAAGFFAAINCAQASRETTVLLLERGPHFLAKVKISGGGRCNLTHACPDIRELASHYPRGHKELTGPFSRFQVQDTIQWFADRGVRLKTEADGRLFPLTDSSRTIIDCFLREAQTAGVRLHASQGVEQVRKLPEGGFELAMADGTALVCDRLLLATGGCRTPAAGRLAASLGHTLEFPVPSLFSFQIDLPWLRQLAGIAVDPVEATVPGTPLRERGVMLLTHEGLSGPVILRLSAWGARALHETNYRFPLRVNWLPHLSRDEVAGALQTCQQTQAARLVANVPLDPLPARLWEQLVRLANIGGPTRWAGLSKPARQRLVECLVQTPFPVTGKSLNKEEFVTCGGVRLKEVNFKTMESRLCPGLYFAGELLDIDGLTGGFNFQAAWTTGWLAGNAMAKP